VKPAHRGCAREDPMSAQPLKKPIADASIAPELVADSLAMGCLLARVRGWLETQRWYLQMFRPVFSAGLVVLILLINRYMGFTVVSVFGSSIINISLAILITVLFTAPAIGSAKSSIGSRLRCGGAQLLALSVAAVIPEPGFVGLDQRVPSESAVCRRCGIGVLSPVGKAVAQASPPLARLAATAQTRR